eukprot:702604-Rhodomonas_salina.1
MSETEEPGGAAHAPRSSMRCHSSGPSPARHPSFCAANTYPDPSPACPDPLHVSPDALHSPSTRGASMRKYTQACNLQVQRARAFRCACTERDQVAVRKSREASREQT